MGILHKSRSERDFDFFEEFAEKQKAGQMGSWTSFKFSGLDDDADDVE